MIPAILEPISVRSTRAKTGIKTLSIQEAAHLLGDPVSEVLDMLKVGILERVNTDDGSFRVSEASVQKMHAQYEADKNSGLSQFFDHLRESGLYDSDEEMAGETR